MVAPPIDELTAQVGIRTLAYLQKPNTPNDLDDLGGQGESNVVLAGKVHPFLKWQTALAGFMASTTPNSAALLELVAKVEIADALNLWMGRMPIPADRANLSTVWATPTWTQPGRYQRFAVAPGAAVAIVAGPRPGHAALGRGDGATLWGQLAGGRFKYYAGAFGFTDPTQSPLYSARIALALLDPEPGYRAASSYHGKDVLSVGIGVQHQSGGSLPLDATVARAADFDEINVDLLFEIGGDSTGVLDVEGAVAKLWGSHEAFAYQAFGLLSYLVPLEVGFGRFQPLLRVQRAGAGELPGSVPYTAVDTQLGYIVDGHHARISAGWSYVRHHDQSENALLLGVQLLSKPERKAR